MAAFQHGARVEITSPQPFPLLPTPATYRIRTERARLHDASSAAVRPPSERATRFCPGRPAESNKSLSSFPRAPRRSSIPTPSRAIKAFSFTSVLQDNAYRFADTTAATETAVAAVTAAAAAAAAAIADAWHPVRILNVS